MIIELLDGTRFDIADYNLIRLFHYIPSAEIEHTSVPVDGRSNIIIDSKLNNRVISVEMIYDARDIFDYYAIRDEINNLFLRDESYYIIFKNEPFKRWLVRCANGYNVQPNKRMEAFTIEFITLNTFAESVSNTKTLKEWDEDSWGWNGAIEWDTDLQYTFSTNSFVVKNLGNAIVDPRKNQLEITARFDTQTFFQLINRTTGEIYEFYTPVTKNDDFKISGINTTLNGISMFSNTNKKLITLKPGDNEFTVNGANIESISFDFRFLYK